MFLVKRSRSAAVVAVALAVTASFVDTASAVTKTGTKSVSCDGATTELLGSVWTGGDSMMFKKLSAYPSGNSYVTVRRSGDVKPMDAREYAVGTSQTWRSFNAGQYLFHARRVGSKNCNGAAFGNGNYSLDFLVSY